MEGSMQMTKQQHRKYEELISTGYEYYDKEGDCIIMAFKEIVNDVVFHGPTITIDKYGNVERQNF